jgi:hypothetical protein
MQQPQPLHALHWHPLTLGHTCAFNSSCKITLLYKTRGVCVHEVALVPPSCRASSVLRQVLPTPDPAAPPPSAQHHTLTAVKAADYAKELK